MPVVLPSYVPVQPPEWCARYVGKLPYERGARGPDLFDCWGAVMLVLHEQAGLDIPSYEGVVWRVRDRASRAPCAEVIARESEAIWRPINAGDEQEFDAVVLRVAGRPLHVGVVATPGWVLHSDEAAGCALERYDGMHWRNRVEGFWRFKGAS